MLPEKGTGKRILTCSKDGGGSVPELFHRARAVGVRKKIVESLLENLEKSGKTREEMGGWVTAWGVGGGGGGGGGCFLGGGGGGVSQRGIVKVISEGGVKDRKVGDLLICFQIYRRKGGWGEGGLLSHPCHCDLVGTTNGKKREMAFHLPRP